MVYAWEFEFFDSDGMSMLCHVARWAEEERLAPI